MAQRVKRKVDARLDRRKRAFDASSKLTLPHEHHPPGSQNLRNKGS